MTYRPGMPIAPPAAVTLHQRVEHGRGRLLRVRAVTLAAGLEADGVDGGSRPRARRGAARSGRAPSPRRRSTVSQPKLRACARRSSFRSPTMTTAAPSSCAPAAAASPTGSGAGDVDRRAHAHARGDGAVEAGREDVGEHRQVEDLLERLIAVRELQQVPVGVRHQDVLGLTADPAAHVDVAVGAAGSVGIDVQADAGLALLAVAAAAARDVEGHRDDVADLDELDVGADLDDLAGDLVAEDQAGGGGRAAAHHVLVGAADVRRDRAQDRPVRDLPADVGGVDPRTVVQLEVGVVGVDHLHDTGSLVGDRSVSRHLRPLSEPVVLALFEPDCFLRVGRSLLGVVSPTRTGGRDLG